MMILPLRSLLAGAVLAFAFTAPPSMSQTPPEDSLPERERGEIPPIEQAPIEQAPLDLDGGEVDSLFESENDGIPQEGELTEPRAFPGLPDIALPDIAVPDQASPQAVAPPDYSRLPEGAEREAKLDALFERLQAATGEEAANLIAEEIWAIWLDSGSDSVNLLLRRGNAAHKRGNKSLARRMYNHVTELAPDYAEGWSRSGRLALEEEDFSRALSEITQALILEPRQFYAHWTLGNIFERVGRTEPAYEAYKEANRLYPELKPVKDRLEMMKGDIDGDVL
jgi:tetratricopeptide (TPR) repeat protein